MRELAEKLFLEMTQPTSVERERYDYGTYDFDPAMRKAFTRAGKLDIEQVYISLYIEEQQFTLTKRIMQFDLTEEEVHAVIKYRFKKLYPNACSLVEIGYPSWCKVFNIKPDGEFVDSFPKRRSTKE